MKNTDNVRLAMNKKVMPFTLCDVINKAKQIKPHYSLMAQLCIYVSFQTARIRVTKDAREIFEIEQELKMIKLLTDGSEYANKFTN